jgi:hypothetical protein
MVRISAGRIEPKFDVTMLLFYFVPKPSKAGVKKGKGDELLMTPSVALAVALATAATLAAWICFHASVSVSTVWLADDRLLLLRRSTDDRENDADVRRSSIEMCRWSMELRRLSIKMRRPP